MSRLARLSSITEASQVGAARRRGDGAGAGCGFDESERGKLALVVTEAGNNLLQHAQGGKLLLRALSARESAGSK